MFDIATRNKLRVATQVGHISVEDLWDLPLTSNGRSLNLDDIAIELNKQVKATADQVSFVNPTKDATNESLLLAFDIVKHIISVKVAERDAAAVRKELHDKKQRILSLIDQKKNEKLAEKTVEELEAMVGAL